MPTLTALLGLAAAPSLLLAQGAVDPSIAPRAAQLARMGGREQATELLGRYLATAPDDGAAWLELGKFYLADSRAWHHDGHLGEPPGALFLDFAATALDQSLRLPTDSGRLVRALIEIDRAASAVEDDGWDSTRASFSIPAGVGPPAYVMEIGRNLVRSCPVGGVLVTGSELEAVGVWSAVLEDRGRNDLMLILGARLAEDSVYRNQMGQGLHLPGAASARAILAAAALRRPVCFSPATDSALVPAGPLLVTRLVRVAGPVVPETLEPMSVIDLVQADDSRSGALVAEVLSLYQQAARDNPLLCVSLLAPLAGRERNGCGR